MLSLPPSVRLFVATQPVDGRKGPDSLMALVRDVLRHDPLSGHLFVFANRPRTRIKVLYWDGSGTWVCAKRLAKGCFSWPRTAENETGALRVLAEELTLLLSGIDLEKTRTREWWRRAA